MAGPEAGRTAARRVRTGRVGVGAGGVRDAGAGTARGARAHRVPARGGAACARAPRRGESTGPWCTTRCREERMSESIWAEPRHVASVEDCYFYHTMDIPGHGLGHGEWDLRAREASYLGHVELKGKRVLELGTASGHRCFAMERMGAEVVGYDLSDRQEWDIVPFAGVDVREHIARRKEHIRRLNNG